VTSSHRPLTDADPTAIALAWLVDNPNELIEEFIGIVRAGRRTARGRSLTRLVRTGTEGFTGEESVHQPRTPGACTGPAPPLIHSPAMTRLVRISCGHGRRRF